MPIATQARLSDFFTTMISQSFPTFMTKNGYEVAVGSSVQWLSIISLLSKKFTFLMLLFIYVYYEIFFPPNSLRYFLFQSLKDVVL